MTIDRTLTLETLEVAPSDPHRLYVSGYRGVGASVTGVLLASADDGATWTARDIPLDPAKEKSAFIAAVDPTNPERVYVRTSGDQTSRLIVTNDAGRAFTTVFRGASLDGFALSPDGAKVHVGGIRDGLWVASAADFQFRRTSSVGVRCLQRAATTPYICSSPPSGFIVGASEDDGVMIARKLQFDSIRGALSLHFAFAARTARSEIA